VFSVRSRASEKKATMVRTRTRRSPGADKERGSV
jgi:hypothetical protein